MGFLIPIAILSFVVLIHWLIYKRGKNLLHDWADQNGFEILRSERRWIRQGPFFLARTHPVFRIQATDLHGAEHLGWSRCNLFGKVDVIWDAEEPQKEANAD